MNRKITVILLLVWVVLFFASCNQKEISNEYIKVMQYKDILIGSEEAELMTEVTEPVYQQTDRTVVNKGDRITANIEVQVDGVKYTEASNKTIHIVVGAGEYIESFEEQIIGHTIDEIFYIEVVLPESYTLEPFIAGQTVGCTITVSAIEELSSGSVDNHQSEMNGKMLNAKEDQIKRSQLKSIKTQLIEQTEVIKYPKGKSEADLMELIIDLIAETEELVLTDEQFEEKLDEYALNVGYENGEELIAGGADVEKLKERFQEEVVMEWLLDHAKKAE